ncbi:MAG TPA: hypothetical protein VHM89_04215 [Acidimicrobiales bacterium]|nr:hypothetical protein [Acidimicrobiales bacterium]
MRLPGATSYMEALQDPALCFADPELAAAVPVLGPLGLPRAISGNVAVVFRLDGAGGRSWAVRCFVRPLDEERSRYAALRAHLATLESSWRVGFDLQPCGIRVDGAWWPVLKMEWVRAEPLLAYVERHLWDGAALGYLATRVTALAERLRADGVAHGDLQHGNILVAPGGDLRLVDYDGMFVPGLAGLTGTERGHRNYQHPGREVGDFGPDLDSFSSWVIYASLAALAADPLLWGRLDGGEEAFLLRQHDLQDPDRSAALAAMETSDGPGVPALAELLRSFLAMHPNEVPPLSLALAPALHAGMPAVLSRAAASRGTAAAASSDLSGGALPPWDGPLAAVPGKSGRPPVPAGSRWTRADASPGEPRWPAPLPGAGARALDTRAGADPSPGPDGALAEIEPERVRGAASRADDDLRRSLYDALTAGVHGPDRVDGRAAEARAGAGSSPVVPVTFGGDLHEARHAVAMAALATVCLIVVALVGVPPALAAAGVLGAAIAGLARIRQLFLRTPEAQSARAVGAVLAEPRRAAGDAVAAVDRLARRRAEVAEAEDAAAGQAADARARLRAKEDAELRDVDAGLETALAGLSERERAIGRAEKEARAAALVDLQATVMDLQLTQHSLVASTTCGVSEMVVRRLALDDVRTAADFTDVTIDKPGGVVTCRDGRKLLVTAVDERQAAAMLRWRRQVSGVAQLKVPHALPPERVASIRAEFDGRRAAVAAEAESARAEAKRRADAIRDRWRSEHEKVVHRQKQVEADAARQRVDLDRDLSRARKDVAEAEWRLNRHEDATGVPAEVRLSAYLRQVLAVGPFAGTAERTRRAGGQR